ncbi:hypothetical protein OESDEN_10540 [Oesophagostomum dentatum]|uniref:Uncharacterized protein n=1 Tax=Oesophagostomum dentatum TaxID=61180 RepID=A0A0B1T1L4_OESDE|nr:hypothetical protein OESDEN_10540 [Oesophagostomum dentatum]
MLISTIHANSKPDSPYHQDNAEPYTAKLKEDELESYDWLINPQPVYTPDLDLACYCSATSSISCANMSFWQMCRLMDQIMGSYMNEASRNEQALAPYFSGPGRSVLDDANQAHQVVDNDEKFAVSLDVSQFRPEELKTCVRLPISTVHVDTRPDSPFTTTMPHHTLRAWTSTLDWLLSHLQLYLNGKKLKREDEIRKGFGDFFKARSFKVQPPVGVQKNYEILELNMNTTLQLIQKIDVPNR